MSKLVQFSWSAAAVAAGICCVSAPAVTQPSSSQAAQPGNRVHKTIITMAPATLRTPADMEAYQAAHPSLALHRAAHRPGIPMGRAAYDALKRRLDAAPAAAKPMPFGANVPPPTTTMKKILQATGPAESAPGTDNGYFPPDSNGAIGGNQIVVPVNSSYNVYDRSGAAKMNVSFNGFFPSSQELFDPRVLYDPVWKRWVVAVAEIPPSGSGGCFWIGVSKTSSATGSFWTYHSCVTGLFGAGGIWDFPILGMSQDAVLFTGNNFDSGNGYHGAVMASLPKATTYNGKGWYVPVFSFPTSTQTLTPPIVRDSSANAFFLGANSDGANLDIYKATNLSNAFQTTVTGPVHIAQTWAAPRSARQYNTTEVLDTSDGRFVAPSSQYTISGGHTVLWNVHTVALGSFPAPHFYEIDTDTDTFLQNGVFFESGTSDDFNASIAANTLDEAFVTWSATDPANSQQAMIRFSGRQSGDPANSMNNPGKQLEVSPYNLTGNKQGSVQRWGDYSSVFLDSNSPSVCGGPNHRAAVFNEKILDHTHWAVGFGIVGFC